MWPFRRESAILKRVLRKNQIADRILRAWNFTAPTSDMVAQQEKMTNVYVPALEAITPGSGCYLSEVRTLETLSLRRVES